ncbi:hypothetical protein Rcae01_03436 [Novipirellula caenicola]|uniref:Uncharacterized protein n=1 Tax=Novipirellula caenicola TaxID=1536901 RepID=A0ABP9VUQ1_9BACT
MISVSTQVDYITIGVMAAVNQSGDRFTVRPAEGADASHASSHQTFKMLRMNSRAAMIPISKPATVSFSKARLRASIRCV